MSIRSIDMQVMIPRATEAQKQQSNLAQQNSLQQQQFAEQLQKEVQLRQQQVQKLAKSQGGRVERDESQEKQNKHRSEDYPRQQAAANVEDDQEDVGGAQNPVLGHVIDIKT